MTGQGKRIGYIRVSSLDQNTQRQLDGIPVDKVFEEKASGKDQNRPKLQELLEFAREGDTVVVWSMDRLARNLMDLQKIVEQLTAKLITVEFVKENLTFKGDDSPMSLFMLQVMGAFSQLERSLIRERQREGIAIAKKAGRYKGRKPVLDVADRELYLVVRGKVISGVSKARVARELGVSRMSLYKWLGEVKGMVEKEEKEKERVSA